MKKFIEYALNLNRLYKMFGFEALWQAAKSDLRLQILENPESLLPPTTDRISVLVLSPHPDDDVFACAGTLIKHSKAGAKTTVLYLSDGSKGTRESIRDSSLVVKRKREAESSAKIIGVGEVVFWGYKDSRLEANRTSVKAFTSLFREIKPDIVYLPSLLDGRPDHKATNDILYKSILELEKIQGKFPFLIIMYESWTPLFLNRLINISDVAEIKKQAMRCHESQLKSRAYDKAMMALNQYRAEANGLKGFGEAFFASSIEVYKKLYTLLK